MNAATEVLELLRTQGLTLAVAESLTGGALTAALVAVPGASAVLRGGVLAYATDVKARVLGVDPDLLAQRGAVDEEVARQMARGVRRLLGADVALATTGVAGPGPNGGVAAGTVVLGLAMATPGVGEAGVTARAARLHLSGDRAAVRQETVVRALSMLLETLHGAGPASSTQR